MNYLILTETDFFALIDESGKCNLEAAYGDFVQTVISLCSERADSDTAAVVLLYTEIELQYHRTLHSEPGESHADLYVRKALSFVRRMQKLIASSHAHLPPRSNPSHALKGTTAAKPPALQWTGSTLDLVELIYGLGEMGCINNGETPLKVLAPALYEFFGLISSYSLFFLSYCSIGETRSKNLFPCSSVRQYFLSSDQPLSISCFVINLCCGTVFPSFR